MKFVQYGETVPKHSSPAFRKATYGLRYGLIKRLRAQLNAACYMCNHTRCHTMKLL